MDDNVFKPPQSELGLEPVNESGFYIVSPQKFLLLTIFTMGMYFVYWFYKNWKNQMDSTGEKMLPVMRAIFSIFFIHSLFRRIDAKLKANNKSYIWSATGMATLYVVSTILEQFVTFFDERVTIPMLISLFFFAISAYAIYKAQLAINTASDDPQGKANSTITAANIIWFILGGLFWVLALLGMYEEMVGLPILE